MRDYGKVYTAFWTSEDVRSMSEDARVLALYLMTCPHGNMLGCFRLSDAYAAEDIQWELERVRKAFAELFVKGFAYRCDRSFWVFIRYYLKWNNFENPNVATKAFKLLDSLRIPNLQKGLLINALREFGKHFDQSKLDPLERILEPFENPFDTSSKTIAIAVAITVAKPEPEPEPNTLVDRRNAPLDRDVIPTIFAYWQKVMNSPNAKLDAKRVDLIRKALKLYEPRQLCEAILGCSRSPHHMGKNDRNTKYNGLGLILRNAEYIDKFIELASQSVVGEETIEQRNARIMDEFLGGAGKDDPNTIDMEGDDEG